MFRRRQRHASQRDSDASGSRSTISTQPIAVLPNGYRVVFEIDIAYSPGSSNVRFDWDPHGDPESFVDVALDELYFALDISQTPCSSASESQHEYVRSLGGIQWSPVMARSTTEPKTRIRERFGEATKVQYSLWGAFSKGLRLWSIHLGDKAIYILPEGHDTPAFRIPLSHILGTKVQSKSVFSLIDFIPDVADSFQVPPEERASIESDVRTLSFTKANFEPGFVKLSEAITLSMVNAVPSVVRRFQSGEHPEVEVAFLQTAKGPLQIPLRSEDFLVITSHYAGDSGFVQWLTEGRNSLTPWKLDEEGVD